MSLVDELKQKQAAINSVLRILEDKQLEQFLDKDKISAILGDNNIPKLAPAPAQAPPPPPVPTRSDPDQQRKSKRPNVGLRASAIRLLFTGPCSYNQLKQILCQRFDSTAVVKTLSRMKSDREVVQTADRYNTLIWSLDPSITPLAQALIAEPDLLVKPRNKVVAEDELSRNV